MELYQDELTRRPNGLLYKMRELFNREKLTIWEYSTFKEMVRSFSKQKGYHFNEDEERIYKIKSEPSPKEQVDKLIDSDPDDVAIAFPDKKLNDDENRT